MADLLQDLEEEAQRERWRQFMRRYGLFFIAGALLALALTLAWLFWQQQRANAMEARSEAFLAALDSLAQGDPERASRQFADLGEGLPALATRLLDDSWQVTEVLVTEVLATEVGDAEAENLASRSLDADIGGDITSRSVAEFLYDVRHLPGDEITALASEPLAPARAFYQALALYEAAVPEARAALDAIRDDPAQPEAHRFLATLLIESLPATTEPDRD
jgi:hypothetical protein